ncbi:MAG: hypothetical protein IPG60_10735 [Bacteroidetes bacterium]|nr:hypothetical protein [Bacteroidota bacterium]
MPEHEIIANLPQVKIQNKDAEIEVKSDSKLLGTLLISRGSLAWRPSGFDTDKPFEMSWEKFDELMRKEGSR